ncbi:Clp protease N-terminal domain-containing protein [Streptomyces pseudovenezuelae]|uniref:ATP-dependent Clp protease ATP-binding subunit ClpA n=1 Tax=Streptomyces pseudovenezuelae TaxID=67350 RepID=A0ABT6LUF8_9ACTN|nr:Clp protease N-terminal domain-containing protein [Streptomyces pseudovenezuelae]MDH6219951.1 ATP-dependent Clp protease ATP-binding subunit ClpA [Streptomyces pseudovenezuelae]
MFERFTKNARAAVQGAVEQAERSGARSVDAEHILLALLDREGSRASFALAALGVASAERKESLRLALAEARRRAGLSQAEAEALAGLGIDVSEIIARVEEVHGVGAMSGDRKGGSRGLGRRPFERGAKEVLVRALRTTLAHGDRHVGDEHLLLALTLLPGVPAEALADHGVTHESLSRVLYGEGEAKAG